MHTVELLEEAIQAAHALGYQVRQEWLGGAGGGGCEIKGRKHLFIDVSLSLPDQLQLALDVLRREGALGRLKLGSALRHVLLFEQERSARAA
jgi:hypothetical protein